MPTSLRVQREGRGERGGEQGRGREALWGESRAVLIPMSAAVCREEPVAFKVRKVFFVADPGRSQRLHHV